MEKDKDHITSAVKYQLLYRLKEYIRENNVSYEDLEQKTGLSLVYFTRFDTCNSISLANFFNILMALDLWFEIRLKKAKKFEKNACK
ncbi:MAG: hypothetical protein IJW75_02550 [Alphaproteobacteria bacterium]|nr:hypothetical protein [Alphaproteobacteria bacterium]